MKVFIGSSSEAKDEMREVARWIEDQGHQALLWDEPGVFMPGEYLFTKLRVISQKLVDAAVLIFSEDDKVWFRDDMTTQPRDNILLEYGLFAGQLGEQRAIVCKKGNPKQPVDLRGIQYVDLDKRREAELQIRKWISTLLETAAVQPKGPSLGRGPFGHLCGIALLKKYEYHDEYFRREMYVLKDLGYIQPRLPHKTLEFYEVIDKKNLVDLAEPTDDPGWVTVQQRSHEIPPELLVDKDNFKADLRVQALVEALGKAGVRR
jgi:hypothetical protein